MEKRPPTHAMRILILNYEHPPDRRRRRAACGEGWCRACCQRSSGARADLRDAASSHRVGRIGNGSAATQEPFVAGRIPAAFPKWGSGSWLRCPAAISEIRRQKPDVIHAHFAVPTGAVAWAAHRVTGIPYVLTAHLGDVPGGVPEQTGALFRWIQPLTVPIWKDAAATTAVSSFVAGLGKKAYGLSPR